MGGEELMTIIIVQCRLDSSRLPRKALLPLGGRPLVAWTLASLRQVPADHYVLAVDQDSYHELEPVARDCGWDIFAGPKEDVLERFCDVASFYQCVEPSDIILRGTADNPFLFYEAATLLLEEMKKNPVDYLTFAGLPHGSGIEVFNARSLIEACGMTDDAYDHEHVGPALYRHPKDFASVMLPSPSQWHHPDLRTTVDTYRDYRCCLRIVSYLSNSRFPEKPYTSQEILSAFSATSVIHPVLCVPSVAKGRGTGHLRRCLDIAKKIKADILVQELSDSHFVQEEDVPPIPKELLDLIDEARHHGLEDWQFRNKLPEEGEYSLILSDYFSLDRVLAQQLSSAAPLFAIDEGSTNTSYCDYLLDIIPSHRLGRVPNLRNGRFISLPKHRREPVWSSQKPAMDGSPEAGRTNSQLFSKILVSTGGEDPAGLSMPAAIALGALEKNVTVIVSNPAESKKSVPGQLQRFIRVVPPVTNLREKLYQYDVVVTHYGFTAFEALAAGCGVILLGTSSLHQSLGQKYGFASIPQDSIGADTFQSLLEKPWLLYPAAEMEMSSQREEIELADFVVKAARGTRIVCPICQKHPIVPHPVVARTPERTFRRCSGCGIIYMSWTFEGIQPTYTSDYFFDDYKKQYGKTYLEDFATIKNHGVRRMSIIDALFLLKNGNRAKSRRATRFIPTILDIGCAYGPFLSAGADAGWQVFGTDISPSAVEYVQNELKFPALCTSFPNFNPVQEFGIDQFEAVTMWYVIEHFRHLEPVLKAVSKILKKGGVFAFSTPSAAGVSAIFNSESFFNNSPSDHYTLWEPKRARDILRKFGFKVERIVSTGHHPERFPSFKSQRKQMEAANATGSRPREAGSLSYSTLYGLSRCFKLGDTFEVYCIKTGEQD